MKKRKKKKILYILIVLLGILAIGIGIYGILTWKSDNKETKKLTDDLPKAQEKKPNKDQTINVNPPETKEDDYWYYTKMNMLNVDFNDLKRKNSDTVGWIKVNGTNINYPVVQANNNDYYLNRAFDKTKNDAGWVFADYRNNMQTFDKNTIIYGHGRLNNTMFGSLKNILKSSWYGNKDNYIIKFSTPTENTLWQVFSVYSIKVESYYITTEFNSNNEFDKFVKTLKTRSKVSFNASVNGNDKIITLSTCKDVAGTERVVMHAKLIKKEVKN